jgi:26S proteasome regulatory subunit N6
VQSKAALTAARTAANAIYCPPALQAQIDTQSGVLHAEEKDYKTAYSYFFEAMEAFFSQESPLATQSLKHMLLCKIMTNASEEVPGLIDGKASKTGTLDELEAMRAIAEAYKERSLAKLIETMAKYPKELKEVGAFRAHPTCRTCTRRAQMGGAKEERAFGGLCMDLPLECQLGV